VDGPGEITARPLDLTWTISPIVFSAALRRQSPIPELERTPLLPCDLSHLPHWTADFELADGMRLHVDERFQDLEEGTGPAEIVKAEFDLGGEKVVVEDYWRLCYTAGHHNDTPYPAYWILFDSPVDVPGFGPGYGIEVFEHSRLPHPPPPPEVYLLGEDHTRVAQIDLVSFERLKEGYNPLLFRRGDVDFDGHLAITDAVLVLRFLFQGGFLPCHDAADIDDLGSLDITDPILLLEFLYLGGDAPLPPFPECGIDEIEDIMPVCAGPGCS